MESTCAHCQRPTRRHKARATDFPGTVRERGRGLCEMCWRHLTRAGRIEEYPFSPNPGNSGKRHSSVTACRDCQRPLRPAKTQRTPGDTRLRHAGRGLCHSCWDRRKANDTLIDVPSSRLSGEEMLAEVIMLQREGYPYPEIAQRIGVKPLSLKRWINRNKATGRLPSAA